MSATQDEIDDSSAPLIEHLAELRNRLMWALAAFVAAVCICFPLATPIFNFLSHPVCNALAARHQECNLVMIKLQEGFFVAVRISFLGGFALSFPFIGYQLWRFVAPGLYRSEKRAFLPFLVASPAMFALGAAVAYYIILPMAFRFFLGYQQFGGLAGAGGIDKVVEGQLDIAFQGSMEEYLRLTISFMLAFGLCFQLPVLLTLMGKAGLVSAAGLGSVRKYAILGIMVLAAVVTPPDVVSQIVLFTVVYGLYEVSILLVRGIEKRRAEEEGEEDEDEDEVIVTPPPAPAQAPAAATTALVPDPSAPAAPAAEPDPEELDDEADIALDDPDRDDKPKA